MSLASAGKNGRLIYGEQRLVSIIATRANSAIRFGR